jgi:membrane protease YdiL (CAAX protease family)
VNALATIALLPAGAHAGTALLLESVHAVAALPQDSAPAVPQGSALIQMSLLGLVLLSVTLAALPLVMRIVKHVAPPAEPVRAPWGLAHVALVALTFVVVAPLTALLFKPEEDDLLALLVLNSAVFAFCVLIAVAIAAQRGVDGFRALGLRASGNVRAILAGAGTYIVCIPAWIGIAMIWIVTLTLFGHGVREQAIITGFSELDPDRRLVPLVFGVVLVPLFEEVLFRGFLQPVLVQIVRPVLGIVITSVLFGAMHGLDAFLPIFALSVLLGWIRHRTQTLSGPWAVHALHNGGQFVMLYVFPDVIDRAEKAGLLQLHP